MLLRLGLMNGPGPSIVSLLFEQKNELGTLSVSDQRLQKSEILEGPLRNFMTSA